LIPGRCKELIPSPRRLDWPLLPLASYSTSARGSFIGDEAAKTSNWPLTSSSADVTD